MAAQSTVLVIDDDKDLVNLFRADLRVAGCNVLAAFDAMQGFMLAQREVPSLILLDLQLPAGGGMQLLEKLAKSGKTQAIPVVMVTATDDPKLEAETRAKGAVAFLRKPVERAALVALVQSVLAKQP